MNMGVLTQKIGPLPAWAWGGLVAVAAWYFFLRKPAAPSTGTANAAASGSQLSSGYGLGYAQGIQAAQANAPAPSGTAPGRYQPGSRGQTVWNGNQYSWVVTGPGQGPSDALRALGLNPSDPNELGRLTYFTPNPMTDSQGNTVWYMGLLGPSGQPQGTPATWPPPYAGAAPPGQGGVGGPGTSRKHAIGSRSAAYWSDAHPLIGAKVLYPHYVRAVGGPAAHHSEVARVARQSGIHPARLIMLNPHHTGRIRVA